MLERLIHEPLAREAVKPLLALLSLKTTWLDLTWLDITVKVLFRLNLSCSFFLFFTLSLLLLLTNSTVRFFVVTKKFLWLPVFEGPKIIFETIKEGAPEGFGGLDAWTNGSIDVARCSATKNLSLIYQILSKSKFIDILNSLILLIYSWEH